MGYWGLDWLPEVLLLGTVATFLNRSPPMIKMSEPVSMIPREGSPLCSREHTLAPHTDHSL